MANSRDYVKIVCPRCNHVFETRRGSGRFNCFACVPMRSSSGLPRDWTHTGLECQRIQQDCNLCDINIYYGINRHNGGCRQHEANQSLITRKVPIPE